MSIIYIDRRLTSRNKSLPNRQRLLRRIKDSIAATKPGAIGETVSGGKSSSNPIAITKTALDEPTFQYADRGTSNQVLAGNDQWLKGDKIPVSGGGGSGNGKSGPGEPGGEDGEDDFIVDISKDEFLNIFFEDCELPNLRETSEKVLPQSEMKLAGFQTSGSPAQLSIVRSFKMSKGRRIALTAGRAEHIAELEAELALLDEEDVSMSARALELEIQIADLKSRRPACFFEENDLRFRRHEREQVKCSDAVFCMVMDISGSMDAEKKRMARKLFSLQYSFITRKYPQTDLIFIAHTETAQEMTEDEFFTTRVNGGTIVSPAYALAHKLIKERYDADLTNIYLSYASDGENTTSDNPMIVKELEENGLLSKLRHMVYAEVGKSWGGWSQVQTMIETMNAISSRNKKVKCVKIETDDEVYDTFRKIYAKTTEAKVK